MSSRTAPSSEPEVAHKVEESAPADQEVQVVECLLHIIARETPTHFAFDFIGPLILAVSSFN